MNVKPLTPDERKILAERIHEHYLKLARITEAYFRIAVKANPEEREAGEATDAFLLLMDQAGRMTNQSLDQLATLLEILTGIREPAPVKEPEPETQTSYRNGRGSL